MAVSVVPNAVIMITGSLGSISWIALKVSNPFIPGKRMSRITRSGISSWMILRPASPEAAHLEA